MKQKFSRVEQIVAYLIPQYLFGISSDQYAKLMPATVGVAIIIEGILDLHAMVSNGWESTVASIR